MLAFGYSGLKNIAFPESLNDIYLMAFENCENLETVTFKSVTPPTMRSESFSGCPLKHIYVPSASVDAYKIGMFSWETYVDLITAIPQNSKAVTIRLLPFSYYPFPPCRLTLGRWYQFASILTITTIRASCGMSFIILILRIQTLYHSYYLCIHPTTY